jgi:hypothetical protein
MERCDNGEGRMKIPENIDLGDLDDDDVRRLIEAS